MKLSTMKKVFGGFVLALFFIIFVGIISYQNIGKLIGTAQWVAHTHVVLERLELTLIHLVDAETVVRGYVITGKDYYLDPYQNTRSLNESDRQQLRQLIADNPNQLHKLDTLEPTIALRLDFLEEVIHARRSSGFEGAQLLIVSDRGKNLMDKIRREIAEMKSEEGLLLNSRTQLAETSAQQTIRIIGFAIILACGLVTLAIITIRYDIQIRNHLETHLRASESQLFQFLEVVPVGIFISKANGESYYANQAAQQILGKGIVPKSAVSELAEVYQIYIAGTETLYPEEQLPIVRALRGEHNTVEDIEIRRPDRTVLLEVWGAPIFDQDGNLMYAIAAFRDSTERKLSEQERERLIAELQKAIAEIKTLSGLLPICAWCKNIRDDNGYWNQIESYISDHSDADFSHSICPPCTKKLYPDLYDKMMQHPQG